MKDFVAKLFNILKREEVKQPENEAEKEKEMLALKDTLSSEEKKEFRDQLISLMVPIISWKESPDFRNSEWAISIVKGRHIIEDLKLTPQSSLDEIYINSIWNFCFRRAKRLVKAEIGVIKDQRVNSLTWEEVFECDYALSALRSNYLLKTSFGKSFPVSITLFILLYTISITLHNLPFIHFPEIFAFIFFLTSIFGLLYAFSMAFIVDYGIFKVPLVIAALSISVLFATTVVYSPQQPKPITSTVPQSSTLAKPSPGKKPGFTEPLKDSQIIRTNSARNPMQKG